MSDKEPIRIDPAELEIALKVLTEAGDLPAEHPDSVAVQHAVSKLFKEVKRSRRKAAKRARHEADRQVLEATGLRRTPPASMTRPLAYSSRRSDNNRWHSKSVP